jgi:hypothetical protein
MKLLLQSNQLGLGGTEVGLWDYACGCEDMLGHEVIIVAMKNPPHAGHPGFGHHLDIVKKFQNRFPVFMYDSVVDLNQIAREHHIDVGYFVKSGENDGQILYDSKSVIHVVFPCWDPYGQVYAFVSPWLSKVMTGGKAPWVPPMVHPSPESGNLRKKYDIPEKAIVFGGYGRSTSFDIPFVHETVQSVASEHPEIYFLFNNFAPFGSPLKNVIFIPGAAVLNKAEIIDTCDAMLHGRSRGETFGLAIAEWSSRNKPIITYALSPETAHIDLLGDSSFLYKDSEELKRILLDFKREPNKNWNKFEDYTPEKVMAKFDEVFLRS